MAQQHDSLKGFLLSPLPGIWSQGQAPQAGPGPPEPLQQWVGLAQGPMAIREQVGSRQGSQPGAL